jgi:hypothetical protein
MKPQRTGYHRIIYDNLNLDEELFYFEGSKQKSISPAAAFKPAGALDGQAFQTSTSPSAELKKKTLIIDKSTLTKNLKLCGYQDSSEAFSRVVGILKRLQLAEFKIFLCSNQKQENGTKFHKLEDNSGSFSLLKNLSEFDQNKDYEELAKLGLARDKTFHFSTFIQIRYFVHPQLSSQIKNSDFRCDELNFEPYKIPDEETDLSKRSEKIRSLIKSIALKDHLQIASVNLGNLDIQSITIFLHELHVFKPFKGYEEGSDCFNGNYGAFVGKENSSFGYQQVQGIKKLRESIRYFNFGEKTKEESQEIIDLVKEIYPDENSRPLFDCEIVEKQISQPLNPTLNSAQTQPKKKGNSHCARRLGGEFER